MTILTSIDRRLVHVAYNNKRHLSHITDTIIVGEGCFPQISEILPTVGLAYHLRYQIQSLTGRNKTLCQEPS